MNATEKKIREIAVFLINVQTVNGIAETMNRIVTLIDGYSEPVASYFKGLYEYIDDTDKAFHPITGDDEWRAKMLGAKLIIDSTPSNAVNTLVKLHNMLKWKEGKEAMVKMTDRLYDVADSVE